MNRLKNTRCYLCGPMDRVPDCGVGWRDSIKEKLTCLEITWLDPCKKPTDIGLETPATRLALNNAKIAEDYEYVSREMTWIRRVDLRMIHLADFLIVNLDINIHACGSYEEITLANQQKKPILIHVEQGKSCAPSWLFGMLPHQMIFSTWAEMIHYLMVINHLYVGDNITEWSDNRWHFFNWMGE